MATNNNNDNDSYDLATMNFRDMARITGSQDDTIKFLQQIGLLHQQKLCDKCGDAMKLTSGSHNSDGKRWRCPRPNRHQCSIRSGTFFSQSNLKFQQIIDIIYYWAYDLLSFKVAKHEIGISEKTFVDWRNFLRDICCEYFIANPVKIGGPGHRVQIDESLFVRRKYNVGRDVGQQWVFGGIDEDTKESFLIPVRARSAEVLLPIIRDFILPGTTVISDLWKAYNTISNYGYEHLTVNHSIQFVNPETRAHTNTVENMWMRAKQRNKRQCGTNRSLLFTYLQEFMWREKFGKNPFYHIISHIRTIYPC